MNDEKYWLGFSLIPEIGPKRLTRLYEAFGDLQRAWSAPEQSLRQAGLAEQPTRNLIQQRRSVDLDAALEKVHRGKARLITYADDSYPALLRELDDGPAVLYIRGTLLPEDHLALAIVGTRKATRYGQDAAYHLAKRLARQGITIISGLAHGIDAAAHRGALDGGGRTLAVMGCGVDVLYPQDHGELAVRIAESGALISEFPMGTQPIARNFPRRNRVLSGLALGVLVAEAPENSGALITAGLAAEQGREVFAVPGNIFNPAGCGSNRLIQDGAKLVMDVEDILSELDIAHTNTQTRIETRRVVPTDDRERHLLDCLEPEPIHIDDLVRISGMTAADVSSTLTILELKGLAQMVGHMQYSLTVRHS